MENEKIEFPFNQLSGFPIVNTTTNEIIYLYFNKEESEHLQIMLKPEGLLLFKDTEIIDQLKQFIYIYFIKVFRSVKLEQRIENSYMNNMKNIKAYTSIVLEMNEKFKKKPVIMDKLQNFREIKIDVKKHLTIYHEKDNPFSSVTESHHNQKALLKKMGRSFIDKEIESDSDDDIKKFKKKSNKIDNKPKPISYKEILKKIFLKKLNDFRKELFLYCLIRDSDFKDDNFEKFVSYLEFFITLFSGLEVKYYVDELGFLNLDLYSSERNFMNLAETFHYYTQFRIFDLPIIKDKNGKELLRTGEKLIEFTGLSMKRKALAKINMLKFEDYSLNNVEYYPPFTSFIKALADRFRRYDNYDNYHMCNQCEHLSNYKQAYNLKCSSCFRVIDKTRLIYSILHSTWDFKAIKKGIKDKKSDIRKVFKSILIIQNQEEIKEFADYRKLVNAYLIPIPTKATKEINKVIRNVLGEEIGLYYSWITHYIKWLVFPASISLIIHFSQQLMGGVKLSSNYLLIFHLLFSVVIVLWGSFYVLAWQSTEDIISYIWGMGHYKSTKICQEDPNKIKHEIFMGIRIPSVDRLNQFMRNVFSYFIITISLFVMIFINLIIFYIQMSNMYENDDSPLASHQMRQVTKGYWLYIIPILIFVVREVCSNCYNIVAKWLTDLENNINRDQYKISLLKKQLYFEFFNYYFNLYYVAFGKRIFEFCLFNDCFLELGNQLTMILTSNTVVIGTKLFYKGIYTRNQIKHFESRILEKYANSVNSSKKFVYYTRAEYEEDDTSSLILPIVFNFGYVIQFGLACPISFFLYCY